MVMSGRSWGRLSPKRLTSAHTSPVTDNCPSRISGRRIESMWPDRESNPGPLTLESRTMARSYYQEVIYSMDEVLS